MGGGDDLEAMSDAELRAYEDELLLEKELWSRRQLHYWPVSLYLIARLLAFGVGRS
jgi:hypothetical protein